MTTEIEKIEKVEAFVRKILQENFNQTLTIASLRAVAEKVSRAIEIKPPKRIT
jgi:hypothetical protein